MTPREKAFVAISSERLYQERIWRRTLSDGRKSEECHRTIDEYAAYLQRYQNILIEVCGTSDCPEEKLDVVRKIAALAVACMEQNGAVNRGDK